MFSLLSSFWNDKSSSDCVSLLSPWLLSDAKVTSPFTKKTNPASGALEVPWDKSPLDWQCCFLSPSLAGIGWTPPQNLKYLFLKTYHWLASNPGGFRGTHSNTIHHGWLRGGPGAAGVREPSASLGPTPLSLTLHLPLLPPSRPRASLWEQGGGFPLPFLYWSFAKRGASTVDSVCVRERTVVLTGHVEQVARTPAAIPHAPHPKPLLPPAATAKTILFFCFPHLKRGHQPNCRPWPCFIFPTCILLTPFSYGTYGACHQMRRRHILLILMGRAAVSNGRCSEQFFFFL